MHTPNQRKWLQQIFWPDHHPTSLKKQNLTAPRDALKKLEVAILYATLANEAATPRKEMNIDLIHFTLFFNCVENRPNVSNTVEITATANDYNTIWV